MRDLVGTIGDDKTMTDIWSQEGILARTLRVEAAIATAHGAIGNISPDNAAEIARKANSEFVTLEKIRARDKRLNHMTMAMVETIADACDGDAGEYVHLSVGTSEIDDTTVALQMRDSLEIFETRLIALAHALADKATDYRDMMMPGRSFAQQIFPYSAGLRFAVWADEICRHVERLRQARPRIAVGQIRGVVGSKSDQHLMGGRTLELETRVLEQLELGAPAACDQLMERDRHGEYGWLLTSVALSLDKIAWTLRTHQRTEVAEFEEPFNRSGGVGSSSAPHKRNPIYCERVCGLAKIVKGSFTTMMDSLRHEHECDVTGSLSEDFALREISVVCDAALRILTSVIAGLSAHPENMLRNLSITKGRVISSVFLAELVKAGMGRQKAHGIVRAAGQRSYDEDRDFIECLFESSEVARLLDLEQARQLLDWTRYKASADDDIAAVLAHVRSLDQES